MSTIDELRGLVERATRGPWVEREALKATAGGIKTERDIFGAGGERVLLNLSEADRLLIVAAVNALPALLDERDRLLAVAEAAREALSIQSIGKVDGEEYFRPHMMPETERSLRSLRSALARLDGEVGHG